MSKRQYTQHFVWNDRVIQITVTPSWLGSLYWHLEVRSDEMIPITTTGYRSRFLGPQELSEQRDVEDFVRSWLDDAAKDPTWLRRTLDSRQLSLF